MSGDAENAAKLELGVSGLLSEVKRFDGVFDESTIRTHYADLEFSFVHGPSSSVEFMRVGHTEPFNPLDPDLHHLTVMLQEVILSPSSSIGLP